MTTRMTLTLAAAAVLLAPFASQHPAVGFKSINPSVLNPDVSGYHHKNLTLDGLRRVGITGRAAGIAAAANFDTDWNQMDLKKNPFAEGWLKTNAAYQPGDHFDRNEGETSPQAFARGLTRVLSRRKDVIRLLNEGKGEDAMKAFGQASHGLQDFFAHSNYIDELTAAEQATLLGILLGSGGTPTPRLKMTGFHKLEGGDIAGDTYNHDAFAKDDASGYPGGERVLPGGRTTAFSAAYAAALDATQLYARSIQRLTHPAKWAMLKKL